MIVDCYVCHDTGIVGHAEGGFEMCDECDISPLICICDDPAPVPIPFFDAVSCEHCRRAILELTPTTTEGATS